MEIEIETQVLWLTLNPKWIVNIQGFPVGYEYPFKEFLFAIGFRTDNNTVTVISEFFESNTH